MESNPSTPVIPSTPTGPVIKLPESLPLPPTVIQPTPPPPTVAPPKATIRDGNLLVTRVSDEQKRFGVVIKDGTIRLSPANVQTYELKQEVGQNCYVAMKDVLPGGLNSGGKVKVVVTVLNKDGGRSEELVLDYTIPTPPADPSKKVPQWLNNVTEALNEIERQLDSDLRGNTSMGTLPKLGTLQDIGKELELIVGGQLSADANKNDVNLNPIREKVKACQDKLAKLQNIWKDGQEKRGKGKAELEGRVGGLEEKVTGLQAELDKKASTEDLKKVGKEVGDLSLRVDGLGKQIDASGKAVSDELAKLTVAVSALKTTQTAPPSGGSGSGTGSTGGGQTSAPKPGKNWLMLLIGILATLLFFIGVGGWVLSSLLGGWILGSKATTPTSMMVPAMTTTNVAPAQAQAVTPPPVALPQPPTQGELAKIAEEMKAIRNDQARFLEKENSLVVKLVPTNQVVAEVKATATKSVTVTGNGNILAGHDVTVVNNYNHFSPAFSGNRNCSVATLPAPTTVSQVTGTSLAPPATGEAIVGRFSPTLMSGYVCIPKAADGSGSEGFWVYIAQPPAPGTKSP